MNKFMVTDDNAVDAFCYEVEFVDMEHTIEWLLDAVEKYKSPEATEHLEIVRDILARKRRLLFP